MADINFSDILNQQAGRAEAPKPPPKGTYFGTIAGVPTTRTANTKEGPKGILKFTFNLTDAGEDVDADELEAAGGLRNKNGDPKKMSSDFWLTPDSMFFLDNLIEGFGYSRDPETGFGKSYKEIFDEINGRDVVLQLETETYTNKQGKEVSKIVVKKVTAAE